MICRARQRPGATAWPWAPLAEASGYQLMTEALRGARPLGSEEEMRFTPWLSGGFPDSPARIILTKLERRLQPASVLCCSPLWTGSPRLDRSIGRPPTKRENFAKLNLSRESAATHPNFAKFSSFRYAT